MIDHESKRTALFTTLAATLLFLSHASALADTQSASNAEALLGEQLRLALDTSDPIAADRRIIRVLVSYNDTNYFVANGRQYGLEYELMNAFEGFLNTGKVPVDKRRVAVFISVPFDRLIPDLLEGKGDIAAAGLTITEERKKRVAFSKPYRKNVRETVVAARNTRALTAADELSGKRVHVVSGSSYVTHLREMNTRFGKSGRSPVQIVEVDPNLEAEDVLQMVNAGVYRYTVVDDHIAALWSHVLPDIVPQRKVAINEGGKIAWAVRKDNPRLLKKVNAFVAKHKQGTLLGNMLFKRYYKNTRWIKNPLTKDSRSKIIRYMPTFQKYGERYGIDWGLLAALAFQESGLNQNRKSRAGAVGIMQIKPKTAAGKNIGIKNVKASVENNIHAGTKYLDFLHKRYFSQPSIDERAQLDFTLAAYNAGPARIQSLRRKAGKTGLNPDKWFFNVEHVARKNIGRETVTYVGNIYKYYIAFSTAKSMLIERAKIQTQAGKAP